MVLQAIDKFSRDASYLQLADELKKRRRNGEETLPPFRLLAAEYAVSLGVVQRAIRQLQKESLIQISGRVGCRWVDGNIPEPELQKFGVIHPYPADSNHLLVLSMALNQAFSGAGLNGIGLFRATETAEDQITQAKWLLNHRVGGLLLSPRPATDAAYFEELAGKLPVVAIENELPGSTLPTVVHDYRGAGREIARELKRRGRRRLLILLDTSENGSVVEITGALRESIDATVLRQPLFEAGNRCTGGDYSQFRAVVEGLEKTLASGDFDSVFCPYDEHFDKFFMFGMREEFRTGILPVVICCNRPSWYSAALFQSGALFWAFRPDEFMATVVRRIANWNTGHQKTTGVRRIKLLRVDHAYR